MKGFAITPVLFVGLILITGLMLLNFTDLDRRISEGISKESQLNMLQAAYMENMTAEGTLLLFRSANESTYAGTRAGLESAISSAMGGRADIVSCLANRFTVEFNHTFSQASLDASINRTSSIYKAIGCGQVNGLTGRNATVDCQNGNTLSCLGA